MTAIKACKEAIWIQRLKEELRHKQEKNYVFCDSQNALHITKNPAFHFKTKVEDGSVDLTKLINTDKFVWRT